MKIERTETAKGSTIVGFVAVVCFALILFFNPLFIAPWIESLENGLYDSGIRKYYKPLNSDLPIAIVDIDDSSLAELGRWPWPRNRIAELVDKLYQSGATVIALDILFSDPEKNIAEEVFEKIPDSSSIASKDQIIASFDYDAILASTLKTGESVLSMVFYYDDTTPSLAKLSPPLLTLSGQEAKDLNIPIMKSYLGNIEILEKSVKYGAFVNTTPDPDGILRFSPLLLRYGDDIYPSLGLQATSLYLLIQQIKLQTDLYEGKKTLEGIHLDQFYIPTDPRGRVLIPFRGPPFSFPYISAKDVLQNRVNKDALSGKLIFLGSSATAGGDFVTTPLSPSFVGVEVHATIAAGILNHYLPYAPPWGKGISILVTLILGSICAFLFPRLNALFSTILTLSFFFALIFIHQWILKEGILLPVISPLLILGSLYLFNLIYGFFAESRKRKELREIFGLYVPSSYLDLMLKKGEPLSLDGETKEITVLFSDVEDFTRISEPLSANEIKTLLNRMFTPMTEIIFNRQGTIDKYVGDMIVAFWGAPLEDTRHAYDAVISAFEILKEVETIIHPATQKPLRVRIGINTGLMNVGDMGSKFRRSYTVLGDAVNFGSRLEHICKFYHLYFLVGENTWEQTKDDFLYRQIDKVRVAGKEKSMNIYEPISLKTGASEETIKMCELHNQAFAMYLARDWEGSRTLFLGLQSAHPKDQFLYQVYLDRIEGFKTSPPADSWDGSYVFTEK